MLTESEYKEVTEKVKKAKEYEVMNKELEKQKSIESAKCKALMDKVSPYLFIFIIHPVCAQR